MRSAMIQERLIYLVILSVENGSANGLDYTHYGDIMADFDIYYRLIFDLTD